MFSQSNKSRSGRRLSMIGVIAVAVLLLTVLSACQIESSEAEGDAASGGQPSSESGTEAVAGLIEIAPLDPDQATNPVRLEIPAIGLDVPVTPMEWRVVTLDGERTTLWDVPLDAAGWHVNSAGAGAVGNTALSGNQKDGAAVFAPLALGNIVAGQEVRLTDADGLVFVYRVREVSDPIPVTGASDEELLQAQGYLSSGDRAQLTLITGWPDFTTTHRVFAAADFLGTIN